MVKETVGRIKHERNGISPSLYVGFLKNKSLMRLCCQNFFQFYFFFCFATFQFCCTVLGFHLFLSLD